MKYASSSVMSRGHPIVRCSWHTRHSLSGTASSSLNEKSCFEPGTPAPTGITMNGKDIRSSTITSVFKIVIFLFISALLWVLRVVPYRFGNYLNNRIRRSCCISTHVSISCDVVRSFSKEVVHSPVST